MFVPLITLMTTLAIFAMAHHDTVCYEANDMATSAMINYSDGDRITYKIGVDLGPFQFLCRSRNWPRYFASIVTCDEVPYHNDGNSVNAAEKSCGPNCHSYIITPIGVDCILLKCERGNSSLTKECRVYININETEPSSTYTVRSTESLSNEGQKFKHNNDHTSTLVTVCAIVLVIIVIGLVIFVIGLVIYTCYKGSHRFRKPPDIEDTGQITMDNPVEIVDYKLKQSTDNATILNEKTATSSESEHQNYPGSVEVVTYDCNDESEANEVSSPQESDTTDLVTRTKVQRIESHYKMRRGDELETNHRECEVKAMEESVKPAFIIVGDNITDERPAVAVIRCHQETDENSNAYCFSTKTGVKHHPSGKGKPTVKTVLHEKEMKNYQCHGSDSQANL